MSKKRILLVDDDPDVLETVKFFLNTSDFRVFIARNGREALKQISAEKPDLVLLDIIMPVMDGLEVCKRLKNDPTTKPIPIIMLTAGGRREDVVDSLSAGANGYIVKPFNLPDLVERIEKVIDGKSE